MIAVGLALLAGIVLAIARPGDLSKEETAASTTAPTPTTVATTTTAPTTPTSTATTATTATTPTTTAATGTTSPGSGLGSSGSGQVARGVADTGGTSMIGVGLLLAALALLLRRLRAS